MCSSTHTKAREKRLDNVDYLFFPSVGMHYFLNCLAENDIKTHIKLLQRLEISLPTSRNVLSCMMFKVN